VPTTLEIRNRLAAEAALFSRWFDDPAGRKWVVKKFLDHYNSESDPEADSRASLLAVKVVADNLVNAQRTTHDADEAPPSYVGRRTTKNAVTNLLIRVIYGAFGVHPTEFLDPNSAELLTFIVNRRLRTIFRMHDYVNPPDKYFSFPSEVWQSSVRTLARTYWKGVDPNREEEWPFVLSDLGKQDRVLAVNKLFDFQAPQDKNDRNYVECQTAATMVLMDSLLEAADPSMLLEALDTQSQATDHLAIDFPDGALRRYELDPRLGHTGCYKIKGQLHIVAERAPSGTDVLAMTPPAPELVPGELHIVASDGRDGNITVVTSTSPTPGPYLRTSAGPLKPTMLKCADAWSESIERGTRIRELNHPWHFLADTRPTQSLFEQGFVRLDDIQPGDVFHVLGHPLVRDKIGDSGFGGERCVVFYPSWSLPPGRMHVTGHGIGLEEIYELSGEMLQVANRLLTVSRRTLTRSLAASMVGTPVASGTIPIAAGSDEAAIKLQTWIKETIGRAKDHRASIWNKEDYFAGTWKAHNVRKILAAEIPFWDRGADFGTDYPGQWVLEIEGTLRDGNITVQYGAPSGPQLFIFHYWSANWTDDPGKTPPDLQWPLTGNLPKHDQNYIALESAPGVINPGGNDPRRHFAIPYIDDQNGELVTMPLFVPGPASVRPTPTRLTFDDLSPHLFALVSSDIEAWVLRPRVSADADYFDYLRSIGAIPSSP